MPFATRCTTAKVLRFPSAAKRSKSPQADSAVREKRVFEIHAVCQATTQALGELRGGIQNYIYEALDMLDLDARTLQFLTQESPRTVQALIQREVEGLTTERLIAILEAMHPAREL